MYRHIQKCTVPCYEIRRPKSLATSQSSLSDQARVSTTMRPFSSFSAYQSQGDSCVRDRAANQGTRVPLEAMSKYNILNGMSQATRATQ